MDFTQVNFRMPFDLKKKINSAAIKNGQSLTSELVARLDSTFTIDENAKREHQLEKMIEQLQTTIDLMNKKMDDQQRTLERLNKSK